MKLKGYAIITGIIIAMSIFIYVTYFASQKQKKAINKKIETITGHNLTITVFSHDGKIVKRWSNIKHISAAKNDQNYTSFYTRDNRYVQIPHSVLYIAEEIKE